MKLLDPARADAQRSSYPALCAPPSVAVAGVCLEDIVCIFANASLVPLLCEYIILKLASTPIDFDPWPNAEKTTDRGINAGSVIMGGLVSQSPSDTLKAWTNVYANT